MRRTKFVDMHLDSYYARVTSMIKASEFEDIGHATVRLDRGTARVVWVRVDQWSTTLGRRK